MSRQIRRVISKLLGRTQEVNPAAQEPWDVQTVIRHETEELQNLPRLSCDSENLLAADEVSMDEIFSSQKIGSEWEATQTAIQPLDVPDGTGGVNLGDRRAIYYLLSHFKPRSVLEIGTHIGASTIHVAAALHQLQESAQNGPVSLVSVDVTDVNDEVKKPWLNYGTKFSPSEMINELGYSRFVNFVTSASLDYLNSSEVKYDFIFLDGDHAAKTVYQEIPAALRALEAGGVILLHDYFPGLSPLWSNGAVIPGPFLATERLIAEGANLKVLPLGELPWPTKLQSNITSLALLVKDR